MTYGDTTPPILGDCRRAMPIADFDALLPCSAASAASRFDAAAPPPRGARRSAASSASFAAK